MPCSSCGRKVPEGQRRCYACQVDAPTAVRAPDGRATGPDITADDVATVLLRAEAPHEAPDTIHQGSTTGPAPFVGREPERRRMEEAWDTVRKSATMRVVVVRGPEGVGKTRFVRHCLDKLVGEEATERPAILTGRPPEVDGGRSSAFEGMVRRLLDVPADLQAEEGRRRLLEASGARMVAGSAFQAASLLGRLLQLPFAGSGALHLEGEVLERRMGRALSGLIGAEAERAPLALWIDAVDRLGPFDRRVVRRLVAGLKDHGVLIVLSGREPGNATPPGVDAAHIELGPFDHAAARRMMCSLLSKCPDVPDELIDRVQGRARGNPGAIDGAVRVLMGQGVINTDRPLWTIDVTRLDAGDLPEGADGLLLARIRGLPADDRRVLEAGAIQGREFRLDGVLACLMADERPAKDFWVEDPRRARAEEALARLAAADLIHPGSDPDQWRIADERTPDLALTGMDAPRLARWRRVAASWQERSGGATGSAAAAALWELGDRPTRAARGFKAAGDLAAEQFRGEEAIRCFGRALELLDDTDFYERLQVRLALGDVRDDQGDHKGASQEFEAMLRDSAAARCPTHAALALRRIGEVAGNAGDWGTARTSLARARALYEALNDLLGVAESLEALAQVDLYGGSRGSIAESLANVELALRLRREAGDEIGVAQSYHYLGWIHADAGRDAEAQAAYEAAIRIRREAGDRSALVKSLNNLGDIHVSFGRHEAGRRALLESLAECDAIGLASVRPTILVNLARCHLDTNDLAEAADRIEQVERALEDIDDPMTQVDMHLLNSRLFQALGEQAQAVEQGEAAGMLVEKMAGTYQQGVVLRRLAELHSATLYDPVGGAEATRRADGLFERSVSVLSAAGHDMELALTLDAYARFLTERGRSEEGAQMSRRAAHLRS